MKIIKIWERIKENKSIIISLLIAWLFNIIVFITLWSLDLWYLKEDNWTWLVVNLSSIVLLSCLLKMEFKPKLSIKYNHDMN